MEKKTMRLSQPTKSSWLEKAKITTSTQMQVDDFLPHLDPSSPTDEPEPSSHPYQNAHEAAPAPHGAHSRTERPQSSEMCRECDFPSIHHPETWRGKSPPAPGLLVEEPGVRAARAAQRHLPTAKDERRHFIRQEVRKRHLD